MHAAKLRHRAAGQLFTELSRALFPYAYPVHDLRLVAILLQSLGFGLCLAIYVIWTFAERRRAVLLAVVAVTTGAAILAARGFDYMSLVAVLVPTLVCVAVSAAATVRREPRAAIHLAGLIAFAGAMMAAPIQFQDLLFYYAVAGFLLFLFVQQAFALAEEKATAAARHRTCRPARPRAGAGARRRAAGHA